MTTSSGLDASGAGRSFAVFVKLVAVSGALANLAQFWLG